MKGFILFILWTFSFCIYVEYSVGGIFYRVDVSGKKKLNIQSGLHFLISPLHQPFLWNLSFLDLNYPLQTLFTVYLYLILQKLILQSKEVSIHNGHPQSDNL